MRMLVWASVEEVEVIELTGVVMEKGNSDMTSIHDLTNVMITMIAEVVAAVEATVEHVATEVDVVVEEAEVITKVITIDHDTGMTTPTKEKTPNMLVKPSKRITNAKVPDKQMIMMTSEMMKIM
jgi:hypothetical protein